MLPPSSFFLLSSSLIFDQRDIHSQLQKRQIRITIIGPVLALLSDIVLEYGGGLGIVSVEAIEDGFDMLRPLGRVVECYAHRCLWMWRIVVEVGCGIYG